MKTHTYTNTYTTTTTTNNNNNNNKNNNNSNKSADTRHLNNRAQIGRKDYVTIATRHGRVT